MAIAVRQWLNGIWQGSNPKKYKSLEKVHCRFEQLEPRTLLSGSNAIDRLDFGNLASEAMHNFEPGYTAEQMPILGTGGLGLTYREPVGSGVNDPYTSQGLTFTLAVDPNRQNYLTIKLWGSDIDGGQMYLLNAPSWYPAIDYTGGQPAYSGRFLYYTIPIPISMTSGKTSVQLTLNFVSYYDAYGGTGYHYLANGQLTRPVYSVFSHTDPNFVPDSDDATGTAPTQIGQVTLDALTSSEAYAILLAKRQAIYNSGGYYDTVIARQILPTSTGAPTEVIGLDLFTTVSTWGGSSKTGDLWRSQIATQKPQPGYTSFPDELLSVLYSTYLLEPFRDASGNVVSGLDHYHDSSILQRIVYLMDGASYMQGADGRFPGEGNAWCGLISNLPSAPTARTTPSAGTNLLGIDTQTLGWSIIELLNDPTAANILNNTTNGYLRQFYDADLNGGSMLRAYAYERMLYNHINYLTGSSAQGGTESQNLFEMSGLYASYVALEKLQLLYPNSSYVYPNATAVNYAKMVMGLAPDTLRGIYPSPLSLNNYALSAQGLGEAHGVLSGGYDGGYGLWVTMMAPNMAKLAALDPGLDTTTRNNMIAMANATINAYDQFISTLDYVSGGTDYFTLGPEDFITYRNTENPNSNSVVFNVNSRYAASDPNGPLQNAYALRSAYLETQYGIVPDNTAADGNNKVSRLNFLRDYASYEATIRSLIDVDPTTLKALPGEPNQPDYTWADVQTGAVAFVNEGERFYMNANWRNYEVNNNTFTSMGPSEVARIHYTTDTIDRAATIYLPYNSATVQSDGNYSSTSLTGTTVVCYGDYIIVLNKSTSAYSAKLPVGVGLVEDLATGNLYSLSTSAALTTVSVAAGDYAIFWLDASSKYGPLGISATGTDVGAVGTAGSDSYADGAYTVSGAGADIGGTADAFRFVSTSYTGDVSVTAYISSQTAANNAAEAGVMIRNGSAANAAFAAVVRTPGNGIIFEWRSSTGATMAWAAAATPLESVWVRITRSGSSFSGYYSIDGVNWTAIGTPQTITLSSSALVGLAVSSHNTSALSTAVFNDVSVAAGSSPTVATAAAASASTVTGKTVNLSVLGADNGGESNLTYTWYVLGDPPDQVTYSANKTNAAKNTTVTFATNGVYNFRVIIRDASGFIATSDVSVTVVQTYSSLMVSPNTGPVYVAGGATQAFITFPIDQFGAVISNYSPTVTWSVDSGGVGSIASSGVYTAPTSGSGSAVVRATSASISGASAVTCTGIFSGSKDIGAPGLTGSVSYNSSTGTYTVSGGGTDIWVGDDMFRYVYVPVTGDTTIVARVVDGDSDPSMHFSKAGVMFRSSLDAQSSYAYMSVTYTHGFNFQWRTNNGGSPGQSYTGSGGQIGWVKLVRSGNTFTAYYSSSTSTTEPTTWSQTTTYTQTIAMGSTIYVGFAVTARNNSALNTSTFSGVTLTTTSTSPIFSNRADIGSPSPIGTYTESSSVVTMTAGGSDIYSTADHFEFAYVPITGNVTLTARVVSLVNTNTNAKAGVMIRNSLDSGSPEASALVTYSNGINLDYRTTLNGSSSETKISSLAAPYWVRIVRSGSSFSAYRSSDGSTWTQIGTTKTISMNSTVLVGLAVTSHSDGTATTAVFDNITITGTADVAPTVSTAAAASPTTVTGTTASLSALGADSDGGGESYLTYTWTAVRDSSTPASVTFSANGTNAAKSTTVTFTKAGTYKFKVTIKDTGGLSVTSSVSITVNQTFTSIVLRPATLRISPLGVKQFSAAALDQFGLPMSTQPSFTWSIASGGGSIVSSGATATYTAPLTGASATVRATSGSIYGSTTVTIVNQSPLLAASLYPYAADSVAGRSTALGVLGVDDAGESNLTYTWSVIGTPPAAVIFDVNGSNAAKNTTITFTKAGMYNLRATITDAGGLVATTSLSVEVFSAVAGREIFYNNSKFDSASDANAIATDKQALLPGRTATFANYTSYSLGINGIMVDITGLANATALTAADFQFKVGNDDDPDGWTDAPAPISITVRQGEGTNSSDRVIIIWADGAIKNQWLQVTVLATDNTGLAAADVFYFGNAVGESGDNSANAVVDAQDEINSRANKTGFSAAAITNFYDYNRDGKVNATDDLIARHNRTDGVGADPLQLIAAPVGAPPASYNTLQPMSSGNDPGNLITFLASQTFIHSGGLLTQADFDRMITKVNANAQPWKSGWDELLANSHSSPNYVMQGPVSVVYRGTGYSQNYSKLYNDIAAAYQNALRWKIAGDTACANKAVAICDAWSATLTSIQGTSDKYLAAGLYGYEFAIVAEIMRSYNGWGESANFNRFKNMMTNIFYPMNHAFLVNHNGAAIDHYWCNWDVCNMASIIAIGILCDDTAKYNEAINYFKYGAGNGAIDHGVYYVHPGNLGQSQESGRDQGHATLDISLYGAFCQMAYNQGDDLFAYENNKILALCEYTAKYNLFYDVPYVPYNNSDNVNQTVISSAGRGSIRPSWELIYNHYVNLKGIPAPYTEQFAALVRPEGGGGDYGPNSGGYDQLGFGTLTFTLDPYTPPASVAGRYIFYNNSKFDATADSAAIATDKAALLPGQTATFGNYTSYSLGINGIMVDIKGLANPGALAASDFQFQVGNGGSWAAAPAPLSVGVSQGTGTDGSDRITIAWSDNAIQDKWLQVTVKANTNTGLAAADVFYFGNAVGESGDNSANAVVDAQDEINSRANKTGFSAAAITNFYDYNRDGKVNATDDLIARHNRTDGVGADPLQLIAAPASGDALQPLSAAADIEEISQLVTLSEDNTTSQPATLSAEIATSQSEILPTAAGNSNLFSTIYNAEASNNSVPTLERGNQNSTLERGNQNSTLERGNQNSTPERGNQNSTLERGSQISAAGSAVRDSSLTISLEGRQLLSISLGPAAPLQLMTLRPTTAEGFASSFPRRSYESHGYSGLAQDRLHDAVFARSIAILSLTAENVLPEDSSAPADIETILNDRLSLKSDKSLSRAIDAVLAATRHKQE